MSVYIMSLITSNGIHQMLWFVCIEILLVGWTNGEAALACQREAVHFCIGSIEDKTCALCCTGGDSVYKVWTSVGWEKVCLSHDRKPHAGDEDFMQTCSSFD